MTGGAAADPDLYTAEAVMDCRPLVGKAAHPA
ncbi:Uncharacterised protein [Anaerotruncus sp. 2789STDY5834896]|uniref:Uncharacterized protein n=1 Tax=uncultured Anaerotruncus sp. TaxID=905011 RepID=A0A1C6IAK6_9FIRM|nr:Uncharacterised protein [uncultured Anaerotruncus sp.]